MGAATLAPPLAWMEAALGRPWFGIGPPGPLPLLAVAFTAGLAISEAEATWALAAIFPCCGLALAAARFGRERLALTALLLAFGLAGVARGGMSGGPGSVDGPCAAALAGADLPIPTEAAPALLEFEGRVVGAPVLGFETTRAMVDLLRARPARERPTDAPPAWQDARGIRVQLGMAQGLRPLPSDRIRAQASLDEVETGLPGGLQARRRLDRAGVACRARVKGELLAVMEEGRGPLVEVEALRRSLSTQVQASVGTSPEAALLAALTVGDRSLVSPEQAERFAASGLAHLLSVSGLHLGLTVLGLYRILHWLLCRWSRADPATSRLTTLLSALRPRRMTARPTLPAEATPSRLVSILAALGLQRMAARRRGHHAAAAPSRQASIVAALCLERMAAEHRAPHSEPVPTWLATKIANLDPQRVAALLTLPAAPAYALLTGAQPPVVRAAVGAGLFLVARAAMRTPEPWTSLSVAALAILAWDPGSLHEASFQLSFAACIGLLALSSGLRDLVPLPRPGPDAPRLRRWVEAPIVALTTSAAATLATLPLTAHHFQRVSIAALPANVVAVPVGLVTTALCAIATGAGLVSRAAMEPLLLVAAPPARLLDVLAAWFASWPGSRIAMAPPTLAETLATLVASLALAFLRRAPRRSIATLTAAAAVVWLPPLMERSEPRLLIDFLAVGQGDSTLLRLPDGSRLLVDTGGDLRGERDVAQRVLLPQLAALDVSSLDALILSHLHPDHVGSVPALLELLPVREVWITGRPLEGRFGKPIAEALDAHGIPRRRLSRDAPDIQWGGVRIEVLGPPNRDGFLDDPLMGANDGSLVLRIVHGDVAILLPGDIEAEGEAAILASGADARADLLKAPHHGSSTSSSPAFLDKVQPHHVVFCVGRRNQFGFPRSDVLERYEKRGCQLHRTDRGPVRFASDGKSLTLLDE